MSKPLPGPPPNFMVELSTCVSTWDALISNPPVAGAAEKFIAEQLQGAFTNAQQSLSSNAALAPLAALFPTPPANVDVLLDCSGVSEHERVGIWLHPPDRRELARKQKVPLINILPVDQKLAIRVPTATIKLFIDALWSFLTSQSGRINDAGDPDSSGSTELGSWNLTSPTPSTAVLTLDGTYHYSLGAIGIDIGFSVTITEVIQIETVGNRSWVDSTISHTIEIDKSNINVVEAGAGFISAFFGLAGHAIFASLYTQIEEKVQSALAGVIVPPFGIIRMMAGLLPGTILVAGTNFKLLFNYTEATVGFGDGEEGFVASGKEGAVAQIRSPGVLISGPSKVEVVSSLGASRQHYTALPIDLEAPLSFNWTSTGQVESSNTVSTDIVFQDNAAHKALVSVSVTDTTGATSSTSLSVSLTTVTPVSNPPSSKKNQLRSP